MSTKTAKSGPYQTHFKYMRMQSVSSINEILLYNDDHRLHYLIQMFEKYQMAGKRYEAKAWHSYFRRIAINPVVFYQYNAALFYEDCQFDHDEFEVTEPTVIHGDLHIAQFHYYLDDTHHEHVYTLRKHKRVIAPFTWDLKRFSTHLALIAFQHGFSDQEIMEVLHTFIRRYIDNVMATTQKRTDATSVATKLPNRGHLIKNPSVMYDKDPSPSKRFLKRQSTLAVSLDVQHNMHEINWQSFDTVAKLMTLAEQLARVIAHSHCNPPLSMSPSASASKHPTEHDSARCTQVIQTALSSSQQQRQLIDEIRTFAMTYTEIAQRDQQLFFKHFRNERIFQGKSATNDLTPRIPHPLADARRVPILIVGGGIGGMAAALNFAQAGIRVRLLERNVEFGEVGAGMQLAPNCSRLLDKLGVLKQVHQHAVFPKQIVWMDALSGERLTAFDLGEKFLETFQYPYIVVHRADLFQALHQACLTSSMVTMETNRSVTSVDERPKSIMVECADGMRYDCDLVIAADGLWSSLRKFVHDDGPPISVGYVTYRGTVPIDQVSKEGGLDNVQFWIGPDMHLVQYPIRRGELFNQAAVFKSKRLPDDTDQWGTKDELNERFSPSCQHLQNALQLIQTNFRWPVYEYA